MMRALILLHRWLGVAFCLLFAMWFATGIVMHFVPFPSLTEAERIAGLAPVGAPPPHGGPAEAVARSGMSDATRVRLIARSDGPVYVVSGAAGIAALHAGDLGNAAVTSAALALRIAVDHAQRRGLDASKAAIAERADYDQWTVPNRFDPHRPLFRVALGDAPGTELYVSSVTGEVLLDTTRHARAWNYVGSVTHWIYPTVLRSNWAAWDRTVWWLSLVAVLAAASGASLGTIRIRKAWRRIALTPRGWHAWHHVLGLLTMTFVLTWSVSGWLSMDHGRLFSRGLLDASETAAGAAPLHVSAADQRWGPGNVEVEWFALGDVTYQRERTGLAAQTVRAVGAPASAPGAFLSSEDVGRFVRRFVADCRPPTVVAADDNHAVMSIMPMAPVYRSVCGDVWFHVDGANGVVLERLDPSRRRYRWAYSALHRMDIPVLMQHPMLRSSLIVGLCLLGLLFSLTGVVLGWRRLRRDLRLQPPPA